jgi:hypothetical protein
VSAGRRHLMTPLLQGYVSRDEMMIRLEKIGSSSHLFF